VAQVFTQLALVMLLWGTMCGGLALISDVAVILIDRLAAGQSGWDVPGWVNGRTCMTAVALLVLFPLCLQRHMREVSGACSAQRLLGALCLAACGLIVTWLFHSRTDTAASKLTLEQNELYMTYIG
jgi:hypothetical protein